MYRENAAEGAWDYERVRSFLIKSNRALQNSTQPDFDNLMNDCNLGLTYSNYDTRIHLIDLGDENNEPEQINVEEEVSAVSIEKMNSVVPEEVHNSFTSVGA